MQERIRYEQTDRLGVITLDRPEALNALTRDMVAALDERLARLEGDDSIRALVITGEGRAFCAGVDLKEAEADVSGKVEPDAEQGLDTIQSVTRRLLSLPMPTIAALNGLAVGMGSELTIACDIRVAAPDAYLWFSEARRGLFQSNGVMYLLPRLIGHGRAMEWMMSARKVPSGELERSGFVAGIFDGDFRARALEYAAGIALNSPLSLRLIKEVGYRAWESTLDEVMGLEVEGMRRCMHSDYIKEGLRAFAEKRDPRF